MFGAVDSDAARGDLLDSAAGMTVLLATDEAAAAACGIPSVDAAVVALVSGYDGQPTHDH